ncbi:MAG: hypothetical protein ACXAEU_02295 [Candidatus Hodarchaeales archaeon]
MMNRLIDILTLAISSRMITIFNVDPPILVSTPLHSGDNRESIEQVPFNSFFTDPREDHPFHDAVVTLLARCVPLYKISFPRKQ